jgi:transposase InsO family protein
VPIATGTVYAALIVDCYSRFVVGRRLAGHMRTDLPLDVLGLAAGDRPPMRLPGVAGVTSRRVFDVHDRSLIGASSTVGAATSSCAGTTPTTRHS